MAVRLIAKEPSNPCAFQMLAHSMFRLSHEILSNGFDYGDCLGFCFKTAEAEMAGRMLIWHQFIFLRKFDDDTPLETIRLEMDRTWISRVNQPRDCSNLNTATLNRFFVSIRVWGPFCWLTLVSPERSVVTTLRVNTRHDSDLIIFKQR